MSSVTDATSARRLQDKTAVIFGAAGEVGSAVATELAAQGVRVFLSSRTKTRVQELAQAISSHGETATAAEVDALDDDAVNRYLDDVAAAARRIDILFNAMGPQAVEYRNATSTLELAAETFMLPMTTIVRSQFITARAAARHFVTAGVGRHRLPHAIGILRAHGDHNIAAGLRRNSRRCIPGPPPNHVNRGDDLRVGVETIRRDDRIRQTATAFGEVLDMAFRPSTPRRQPRRRLVVRASLADRSGVSWGQAVTGGLLFWRGRRLRGALVAVVDPGLRPRFFSVLPTPANFKSR
jgi:NAD(P)-dependent dehydrogenase (short-subunit alcohol dehydrogenase family)